MIDEAMGVFASARTPYTSVYVRFTTTQIPEVLRWVLGQGRTVKVLSPPELIGMVKDADS